MNLYILNVVLVNYVSSVNQWLECAEFCCHIVLEHMDGSTALIKQCLKYKMTKIKECLQQIAMVTSQNILFSLIDIRFNSKLKYETETSFSQTVCRVFYLCHFG